MLEMFGDTLGAKGPVASGGLQKRIRAAGGNIKWMESDQGLQVLFRKACRAAYGTSRYAAPAFPRSCT